MAFDASNYKAPEPRVLPVILLLDVSGSMEGDKINSLNKAVNEMIHSFIDARRKERLIKLAIITFGNEVSLHTKYTNVSDLSHGITPLTAGGMTPLGTALRMAKDLIEDRNQLPPRAYRQIVVLVSDGQPNDDWRGPLEKFITEGRSSKCKCFGIPIGNDADRDVIKMFTREEENIFFAENAEDIENAFVSVSTSITQGDIPKDNNEIPEPQTYDKKPEQDAYLAGASEEDEDDW